jgi:lipopolysaccharide export system permease protein
MGAINRYIIFTNLGAFLLTFLVLTGIIWLTQALVRFELVTEQGQGALAFLQITSLVVPHIMMITAPVASMIAAVHVLNKLSSDSEIIAMNGAGMSPWRLFRAFVAATVTVSLLVLVLAAYISPQCMRTLNRWVTEVRADVVTKIVQPGKFAPIEFHLTFHVQQRQPDGLMLGVLVDDARDPQERTTILAEQGFIVRNEEGTYLLLEHGNVQKRTADEPDPKIVAFERYTFDLSQFRWHGGELRMIPEERYLWDLVSPDLTDPIYLSQAGLLRAELHNRLTAPLYPFAFLVIVYTFLGPPRTSRQREIFSMTSAIGLTVALRGVGFVSTIVGGRYPLMLSLQYLTLAATFGLGLRAIARAKVIEPPAVFLGKWSVPSFSWRSIKRSPGSIGLAGYGTTTTTEV